MFFNIIARIPFAVMTGFAFLLFSITFIYWSFKPDVNFLLTKQDIVHQPLWRGAFYIHIFGGMLAIFLGPFQFIKSLRRNFLNLHRVIGKIYISAILFLAAPTGLYMAFYANGGVYSSMGFVLMSVLWFYTTYMAIVTIKRKQVEEHVKWMIRSYALTFTAVTLRVWVPVLSLGFNVEYLTVIVVTAWISWLFNLIFAELLIKSNLKLLQP